MKADFDATSLFAPSSREDVEFESSREAIENLLHVFQDERVLPHILATHMFGEPGGGRLLVNKIIRRLLPVAEGERVEERGQLRGVRRAEVTALCTTMLK